MRGLGFEQNFSSCRFAVAVQLKSFEGLLSNLGLYQYLDRIQSSNLLLGGPGSILVVGAGRNCVYSKTGGVLLMGVESSTRMAVIGE